MKEIKLNGYELEEVMETYRYFHSYRKQKFDETYRLIESFYNGNFWREVKGKLPSHQITPDTNYVHYVVEAIRNSVYSAGYKATVLSKSKEDEENAMKINYFIENLFDKIGMKDMYSKIGKDALKNNFGAIQVGWSSEIVEEAGYKLEGHVEIKYIPTGWLLLDPSIHNYLEGRALFLTKKTSLFDLRSEPFLREGVKAYEKAIKDGEIGKGSSFDQDNAVYENNEKVPDKSQTVTLIEAFYKVNTSDGYRIDQIFIIDGKFIIGYKEDIKPRTFPIRVLYGDTPDSNPYGTPFLKKILSNVAALNLLDSIEATHAYLAQNRPKLVNAKSGLNYRQFTQLGNAPHLTFPVNGNPRDVVSYVDQQPLPVLRDLKLRLENSIFLVTGIDPRYTGRDTGSIQTTGGTDLSQQRIISMTDNNRISNLEIFVESVTKLILDNYIELGNKYPVTRRNERLGDIQDTWDVDFSTFKTDSFEYTMTASPYLPKNTIRLAESATELMNMQGQYQFQPAVITAEEWLMWQDFPQKDLILQRIRQEQVTNDEEELVGDLMSFASMLQQGLSPEEAIQIIVQEKQEMRDGL